MDGRDKSLEDSYRIRHRRGRHQDCRETESTAGQPQQAKAEGLLTGKVMSRRDRGKDHRHRILGSKGQSAAPA